MLCHRAARALAAQGLLPRTRRCWKHADCSASSTGIRWPYCPPEHAQRAALPVRPLTATASQPGATIPARSRAAASLPPKAASAAAAATVVDGATHEVPMKRTQDQEANGQEAKKTKRRGAKRVLTPEVSVRLAIHWAAKSDNPGLALAVYERALAQHVEVPVDVYISILYLCAGGDHWDRSLQEQLNKRLKPVSAGPEGPSGHDRRTGKMPAAAQGAAVDSKAGAGEDSAAGKVHQAAANGGEQESNTQQPHMGSKHQLQQPEDNPFLHELGDARVWEPGELYAKGREIFDSLPSKISAEKLETIYLAMARMAAVAGDADKAFSTAKTLQEKGAPARLRSYTPALLAYAAQGNWELALEVDAAAVGQGLELTAPEYGQLLVACAAGAPWDRVRGLLKRMGSDLTTLSLAVTQQVATYFQSAAAEAAASWQVQFCSVDEQGKCSATQVPLNAIDLEDTEWKTFSAGIVELAMQRERTPNNFSTFKDWLQRHGPFSHIVDGANVALYGQNFAEGGFSIKQIKLMLAELTAKDPAAKPLLVLHTRRIRSASEGDADAAALFGDLRKNKQLYATPTGSNDDWYWLYAAVDAGPAGYLVSNDEMRDHIFHLLSPKFFFKWKQRHQLRYKVWPNKAVLEYPAPFTACIQELDDGSWVFPTDEEPRRWLCAKRHN